MNCCLNRNSIMLFQNKSNCIDTDIFDAINQPELLTELSEIKQHVDQFSDCFKVQIIISFLKSHSINSIWITANPELAKCIVSSPVSTHHIESLFQRYKNNKPFITDFEAYITSSFTKIS